MMRAGDLHALRVLYKNGKHSTILEGLFDSPEALAAAAIEADTRPRKIWQPGEGEQPRLPTGVYLIPNPAHPALSSRAPVGKLEIVGDGGLKDHEVLARRWFLVDVDARRPVAEVSATEEERAEALDLAAQVRDALTERGWPAPMAFVSGNGGHLVWSLALVNDEGAHQLVQAALISLTELLEPGARAAKNGQIDQTVHNASRLWRVSGTTARKGKDDAAGGRPWRMAEVLTIPDELVCVTAEQLRELVLEVAAPDALRLIGVTPPKAAAPTSAASTSAAPSASGSAPSADGAAAEAQALALEKRAEWVPLAVAAVSPDVKRPHWLSVGIAVKALLGEAGFEVWDAWSAGGSQYKASEMASQWRSLKEDTPEAACVTLWGLWGPGAFKAWRKKMGYKLPCEATRKPARPRPAPAAPIPAPEPPPQTSKGDGRLIHPLAPLWQRHMPEWIYQQTSIAVAGGIFGQLALVAPPVRLGHRVLSCDPVSARWHEVTEGEVARLLARWVAKVGLAEVSDSEVTRYYNGGGGGSGKIFAEVQARCLDISALQARVGQQIALTDTVLRLDWGAQRITREQLAPAHYCLYGYDLTLRDLTEGQAPKWQAYLEGLFEGSPDAAIKVEYLKRWAAIAVFGAAIKLQAPALVVKGKAGTGKSTLGKVVSLLMPPESVTSVTLQEWGHEYNRAELVGKLLNFVPELAIDEPIGDLDQVKKIIFGELTTAREIRQKPVSFHPRAAHLFCANGLPNLRKADPAVFKRFAQLEVTGKVIRGTNRDNTQFAEELVRDELGGILADLLSAMERVLHDYAARTEGTSKGLPILASSEAANEEWRGRSDAVSTWLTEHYELDEGMSLNRSPTIASLFKEFKLWAKEAAYMIPNKGTFKQLVSNFYDIRQVNKQDVAHGARKFNYFDGGLGDE